MKIYEYSDGEKFRLSATFIDNNGTYQTTIFWIDKKTFQNFFSVEIEPFLTFEVKTVEAIKAEIKADKLEKVVLKKKPIVKKVDTQQNLTLL